MQSDDHPVVCLTRADVEAFCQWLSKKEGKTYRLPTEAEWEYACRAGTTTPFHFGQSATDKDARFGATSPVKVGSYSPNAFGLHDMHGNVWQWCADWYAAYPNGPVRDPRGPEAPGNAIVRGGCWRDSASRSAHRGNVPPDWPRDDFGARIVCEALPAAKM